MRLWRRLWPFLIICLALFAIVFVGHRSGARALIRQMVFGQQTPLRPHLDVGQPLPPMQLTNLAGVQSEIRAQPGRVLVLNVFATWCPDCIRESPALSRLRAATLGKPVDIVGIDEGEYPSTVLGFARQYGLDYAMYIDTAHTTHAKLGIHYIPATLVIDDRGIVRANVTGALTLDQMKQLVQSGLDHVSKQT